MGRVVKVLVLLKVVVGGGTTSLHFAFYLFGSFSAPDYHCTLLDDLSLKKVERRAARGPSIFKVTGAFYA